MKIRKSAFKVLAWTLVFFLAAAGIAQGAENCKGKCCQVAQEPALQEKTIVHVPGGLELHLNPKTPLDAFLPSCHLSGPSGVQRAAVPEEEPCQDEGGLSCCHMGKASNGVQALPSQGYSWGPDRLFHAELVVCSQWDAFLDEYQRHIAVDGGGLQPRAAPVPLYLKNTSFIC